VLLGDIELDRKGRSSADFAMTSERSIGYGDRISTEGSGSGYGMDCI